MIGRTKTSAFSKVSCCNGKPAYRAKIAGYRGDIWRDGIYTWRLAVTSASEPLGSPAPTLAVQDFWKLAEAKAWFIRFAQEKAAAARAQPGAKATRRKSAAPRGGPSGRERTT